MAKSYRGIIQHYKAAPERIRDYFPDFVELVERYNHNWEVPISYVFSRIEQAKRMTIYCGIVKLHWCEFIRLAEQGQGSNPKSYRGEFIA